MRLEIGRYPVQEVVPGACTRLLDRRLEVDLQALRAWLGSDARLGEVELHLARPGESVRLARIFDVAQPRAKVSGPAGDFPGILSPVRPAGSGRANALEGVAVFACKSDDLASRKVLDMAGPLAHTSPYASMYNLVIVSAAPPGVTPQQHQRALLEAELKLAVALARTTLEQEPERVDTFDLPPLLAPATPGLPRVGYLALIRSLQRPPLDDEPILYGSNVRGLLPTLLHPNEVLDGALTGGYWLFGTETYTIQDHPVVKALAARHGRELWFSGVLASVAPTTQPERERTVSMAVRLAADVLGLDGVILTKCGGGMPETDLMLLAEACEEAGVKTTLIVWERLTRGVRESPLTIFSSRADAVVSIGDRDAEITLPAVGRVIGAADPELLGPLKLVHSEFQGAISQLGASYLTTVEV